MEGFDRYQELENSIDTLSFISRALEQKRSDGDINEFKDILDDECGGVEIHESLWSHVTCTIAKNLEDSPSTYAELLDGAGDEALNGIAWLKDKIGDMAAGAIQDTLVYKPIVNSCRPASATISDVLPMLTALSRITFIGKSKTDVDDMVTFLTYQNEDVTIDAAKQAGVKKVRLASVCVCVCVCVCVV